MRTKGSYKLIFASDHAGAEFRAHLSNYAATKGHNCTQIGKSAEESVDYPDIVRDALKEFHSLSGDFLILLCGSGIGVSIAANRDPSIRAVVALDPEQARMAREHNHANCLCMGSRFLSTQKGVEILESFLMAAEDHAERHSRRVGKLGEL